MRILSKSKSYFFLASVCITPFTYAHASENAETDTAEYDDAYSDAIIVTGSILESQEASIEEKRVATNVTDIASSDSMGRFPDENTAAALARLPGVAVQRDQGQARYIQVRGAPNRWTTVSIDGIPQTGVDEGGTSRSYRFDSVPAVLLSELRINKSLTPDITAEAIVANVDMRTYSPLDGKDGFHASGDLGYGFMDLGDGEQRQGSLRLSWSNDVWGVAIAGSHYQRKQVTDNREAGYDAFGPTDIDIRNYRLTRSNNGLYGTVEFSPEDGQKFYIRGIFSDFTDKEQRNAYQIELEDAVSGTRGFETGDLVGVPVTGAFNNGKYTNKNYIGTAGMEYEDDNGFGFNAAFGFTRTDNNSYLPLVQAATSGLDNVSLNYDRTDDPRFPIVTLYSTVDDGTGTLVRGSQLSGFDQTSLDAGRSILLPIWQEIRSDSYVGKVDFRKALSDTVTLKGGVTGTKRDISGNVIAIGGYESLAGLGIDPTDYVTNKPWDTGFPLGFTLNYVDNVGLTRDVEAAMAANGIDPKNYAAPSGFYDQTETVWAGYAMSEFDLGKLFITAGVRGEYYKLKNSGIALGNELTVSDDYFDLFPSVNMRYNLSDDFVLRLAGQRGISRPAYAAIRVSTGINDVSETIEGGNPYLKPETTWGLDASAEYYLPGNGMLSVAGFYRRVEDVLYSSARVFGSDLYNTEGFDRSGYLLESTFNGGNGKFYGVEFNASHQFTSLPGFLGGFGLQGNLTLLDGDFKQLQTDGTTISSAFPGMSKTVLNGSLFYEKYGISARVSYQWRDKSLDTLGGLGAGESRDAYENLDVTVRYAINDNFTVYADLANLTNEHYVAYTGSSATPTEVEQIGSRYMFGIRFQY
ncbi:MAG: TonB-dependent receptor [Novosphingobium sp.]|nr:TonB-dependent receptor [Novosphingobium sp.]